MYEIISKIAIWVGFIAAFIAIVIAIVDIIHSIWDPEKRQELKKRLPFYVIALIVIFALIFVIIVISQMKRKNVYAGEEYRDRYLTVKISSMLKGPFYKHEPYDIDIEITNNRDDYILIRSIIIEFYNPDVNNKIKIMKLSKNESYYYSIFESPGFIPPKKNKKFTMHGPIFIPKTAHVIVIHSASEEKTKCSFIISQDNYIEHLSKKKVLFSDRDIGFDGIKAIRNGFNYINKNTESVKLFCCMPGKSTTFLMRNNILFHKIEEWVLLFKNSNEKIIVVGVNENESKIIDTYFESGESKIPTFSSLIDVTKVNIGTSQALKNANKLDIIFADSYNGWYFFPGIDNTGKIIPIWRLPYVGSNYLNILINSENGSIVPTEYNYEYCKYPTGSVTKLKKDNEKLR